MRVFVVAWIVLGLGLAAARGDERPLRWLRRLDEGKRVAAEEQKDLFVNFTGLEWCAACIDLEAAVLSRPEFREVEKAFVLVELDFPGDRSELGPLREPYEAWVKQYLVPGYPTIMLMDAAGRPYACIFGYDSELVAETFVQHLFAAQETRRTRDENLAAARETSGADRAKKLHAALQAVAGPLGTLEEHKDDPVLTFYKEEVEELCRLDADGGLGLRATYEARAQARDKIRSREAVLSELAQFKTKEEAPAALEHIEKLLGETADETLRFQLKRRRFGIFRWTERNAEALAELHGLLDDPQCPAEDRRWMLRDQGILLKHLGRDDEAFAFFDQQADDANDDEGRAYFLLWKVNLLLGTDRHDEAISSCRTWIESVKPHTVEWDEATWFLGRAQQLAGRHEEAIATFREESAYRRDVGGKVGDVLVWIAMSQRDLGQMDQARQTLDDAEQSVPENPDGRTRQKDADALRERVSQVRASLDKPAGAAAEE